MHPQSATTAKPGRKISVIGTSGSGKTYVAQALAAALGLEYVCNDAIIWRPGWQATPKGEVLVAMDAATAADDWTFDGNLSDRAEDRLVLNRCDTIVWLDLPRCEAHWQVLRRTLARIITREPLWHGNRESLRTLFSRDSIVWWSLKTFSRRRREYTAIFASPEYETKARIRLRSRREVDAWLVAIKSAAVPKLDDIRP